MSYIYGNPTSVSIYVNSQLRPGTWTLNSGDTQTLVNDNAVYLGYYPSEAFEGLMDEWSIWGRVIGQSELNGIYNNQNRSK